MKHKIIAILLALYTTVSLIVSTIIYWSTLHPLLLHLMLHAIGASIIYIVCLITTTIQDYQFNKLWKDFCTKNKKDKEN